MGHQIIIKKSKKLCVTILLQDILDFLNFILEVINNYIDQMLDKCTWEDSMKLLYFLSSIM